MQRLNDKTTSRFSLYHALDEGASAHLTTVASGKSQVLSRVAGFVLCSVHCTASLCSPSK